ncbi:unnamed protein product [Protopolystoma xenopodis]|uniref:Uncharacterized protein n=1 Tax=Protopolystoma xenopodis TaxID=117903 RepID=A0A3S5FD00_9PLAT|nr:unnamed protein product [Protopolystoma xenopodis]
MMPDAELAFEDFGKIPMALPALTVNASISDSDIPPFRGLLGLFILIGGRQHITSLSDTNTAPSKPANLQSILISTPSTISSNSKLSLFKESTDIAALAIIEGGQEKNSTTRNRYVRAVGQQSLALPLDGMAELLSRNMEEELFTNRPCSRFVWIPCLDCINTKLDVWQTD